MGDGHITREPILNFEMNIDGRCAEGESKINLIVLPRDTGDRGVIVEKIERRDFLRKAALGAAGVAAVATFPSLIAAARPQSNREPQDHEGEDSKRFRFVVAMAADGTSDVLIIDGAGRFGKKHVKGGGSFTHFRATAGLPIVAFGRWKAKKFVGFTENGTFGAHISGILDLEIEVKPKGGHTLKGVQMEVVCNLPGLETGLAEKVKVGGGDLPLTFDTPVLAATAFTGKLDD